MRSIVRAVRRLLTLAVAERSVPRACALLVLGVALGSVAVPAAGEGVLRDGVAPVSAEKRLELAADPYVMRWRVAGMDSDAVFGAVAGAEPLVVNLFGDVEVRAHVRSAKTLEGGSRFLAGALEDGGHFTLFRHATGIVRGEFHSGDGGLCLEVAGGWERACHATGRVEAAWLRQRRLGGWASRSCACSGRPAADGAADVGDQRTGCGALAPAGGTAEQWCGCDRFSKGQAY